MILSNEPGYYKAGEYGIRIENLVLVEERSIAGAEGRYFGFENLTWAPIDKTLVDTSLLNRDELRWWDEYHARVLDIVGPQLEGDALDLGRRRHVRLWGGGKPRLIPTRLTNPDHKLASSEQERPINANNPIRPGVRCECERC